MIIDHFVTGLAGFDPEEFPPARDFTVEFTHFDSGLNLSYLVSSPPTRIYWGWWHEPAEKIRGWTLADIPCGTVEKPYHDSDQGWNLLIWQMQDQIFVAEGDGEWDEERDTTPFTRWFKVSRELYHAGWSKALDELRTGKMA